MLIPQLSTIATLCIQLVDPTDEAKKAMFLATPPRRLKPLGFFQDGTGRSHVDG